jgi:hypothetical protein
MKFKFDRAFIFIILSVIAISIFDISGLDSISYKLLCSLIALLFKNVCPDFYDLPIWQVAVAVGTISAAYFAYRAIRESNRRLEIEQSPHIVIKDRLFFGGFGNKASGISIVNVGRGSAINIRATADPEGKISIIDGSNPHAVDLNPEGYNNGWAVDEARIIDGLLKQGIEIKNSLWDETPDEQNLPEKEMYKSEFYLFLWYDDRMGNRYMTKTKFRNNNGFFKVMENKFEKLK